MRRICMVLVGCFALLTARPASAICKLVINVDRTGSMMSTRADGQTKCQVAQNSVMVILNAYLKGQDFDITKPGLGATTRAEYNTNCPAGSNPAATANTRLVQVREFQGNIMQPLWAGFIPVDKVIPLLLNSGWYDKASGVSLNSCPGPSTPMAQAMCRAARQFSPTPPPGEFRIVKTTTDGEENSSDIVPVDPGETRCRYPGDAEVAWRNRVMNEYTSRGITADAVLWNVGGSTTLRYQPEETREPVAEARGYVMGNVAPSVSTNESSDSDFFSDMALSTGGRFQFVGPSTAISSAVTLVDSDHDGIPDFRDQCVGACASDADHDGIPDATDLCPYLMEDGHSPSPTDGCPDTDFDGIRNGIDQCPQTPEDGLAPYPNDGCPAAKWTASASPNLNTADNGTVCSSLDVTSTSGAASLAKLDILGSHAHRSVLRGTLSHNRTTLEAFPLALFPSGSGTFNLKNRSITMPAGAASGTWTLCITDTDGYGDVGVLNSWSIHD